MRAPQASRLSRLAPPTGGREGSAHWEALEERHLLSGEPALTAFWQDGLGGVGHPAQATWTGVEATDTVDGWILGPGGWSEVAQGIAGDAGGFDWDTTGAAMGWYAAAARVHRGGGTLAATGSGAMFLPIWEQTTVLYDGSAGTLPAQQGWLYGTDPLFGVSATQTLVAGGVRLDTTPAMSDSAGYFSEDFAGLGIHHPDMPTLDRTKGYLVGFDMQLLAESHVSGSRAGFSVIVLSEDHLGIELGFWADEIWAQSGADFTHAEGAAYDTTAGLVTYDVLIRNGTYTLFADSRPLLTGSLRDYTAHPHAVYDLTSFVFLGDDTSSASAEADLAGVSVRTR